MLALFIMIVALCLMAVTCAAEAYCSGKRADEAWKLAWNTKCRVDRMQKAMGIGMRETQRVSYTEGFQPRDSWVDDFSRTSQLNLPKVDVGLLSRFLSWLKDVI